MVIREIEKEGQGSYGKRQGGAKTRSYAELCQYCECGEGNSQTALPVQAAHLGHSGLCEAPELISSDFHLTSFSDFPNP